jgi:hypothetical protein
MNLLPGTQQFAGNNPLALGVSGLPVRVYSVELISGATASTIKLFNGVDTTAATQYGQVDGIASQSVLVNYAGGKRFPAGCYIGTDANNAYTTVVFTTEA